MRALFFFFLLLSAFKSHAYINTDILDESDFIKENRKGDIPNLLNYMNMYYYKNKNCCNDTEVPPPSPVPPSPPPVPPSPPPIKWRGIVYMEVLDILENNDPELRIR